MILSGKSLNRTRAFPVACAEPKVYFGNGVEERETDTVCSMYAVIYFGLTTVYPVIVAMLSPQNIFCKDRTEYTFRFYFV